VRDQIEVDLVQHRCGETMLSDAHDRMQVVRFGAQCAALGRSERDHRD